MALRIYLFGQFKLQADDIPIELPSRPAQSLLAFLALNAGVVQRREKLASLLWADAIESNARSYLRQALWRIRKALESASLQWDDYLTISDIDVTFNRQSVYWLDTEVFLEPTEGQTIDQMTANIQLFCGELLPGFYDEWIFPERDRFQAAYHRKMNVLLDALIETGRWTEAVKWGEQWIRLGYSPEPAFRALMRAYGGLGDRGMVSTSYQRCVAALERDLGVEPSNETRELFEKICRGDYEERRRPESRRELVESYPLEFLSEEKPPPSELPVFVSREQELAHLDEDLRKVLDRRGRVAFVVGEAGSGKTTLLNEFIRRAQKTHEDLVVASGYCNAQTGVGDPYLPFREILELLTGDVYARWAAGAISGEHARTLWNTLPVAVKALLDEGADLTGTFIPGAALVERAATLAPAGTAWLARLRELMAWKQDNPALSNPVQQDLFEQYTRVIKAIARKVPLVLVIDDLQWADLGSISLLFHLSRQLSGTRIYILGAFRSEEIAIGRGGERHPLAPVVSELQRAYGDLIVDVDKAERRAFLEALLDSEPNRLDTPFRDMLFRQTQGHPLFTIELLRGLQERGDLVQDPESGWVEGDSLNWQELPARVEAVITERIDRLPPVLQKVLRAASVEGEVFTAELVAQLQGLNPGEIFGSLGDELDRKHKLVRADSIQRVNGQLLSSYRFRHTQIQKYLYGSLNQVERVHLHEQIGTILEKMYGAQEITADLANLSSTVTPAVKLARHFQEAKVTEKAIAYLHLAGERAVQLSAYREAVTHLEQALALLMTLPESNERNQQELMLQLVLIRAMKGAIGMGSPQVEKILTRARDLCQKIGDADQLWMVMGELSIIRYVKGEYLRARELAEDTLRLAQEIEDPIYLALSQWVLGFIQFGLGELVTAREHFKEVISFYKPEHHRAFINLRGTDAGLSAQSYDACCLWCLGYPDQAQEQSLEAIAMAEELSHPFTLAETLTFSGCQINAMLWNATALKNYAERLVKASRSVGLAWSGAALRYRGEALAMLGRVEEGEAEFQKGLMENEIRAAQCVITSSLGNLAYLIAKAGSIEAGFEAIEQVFARVEKSNERYAEAELYRIKGEILLMMGEEKAAEENYHTAIEIARRQQAKSWELRAATSLARLWQRHGKTNEAKQTLVEVYEWFTEGFDTLDLMAAGNLLRELEELS